ncbi:DUF2339 domain-containing protein [Oxalobacteraceae bacterium]|nr:DUF2339 domain-containing protein [Oxalobacteraceae bacterium]
MNGTVDDLKSRVAMLEQRLKQPAAAPRSDAAPVAAPLHANPAKPDPANAASPESMPAMKPQSPATVTSAQGPAPASPRAAPDAATARRQAPPRKPAEPTIPSSARDWLFQGNLVAKLGLLILFLGVSFLLKYASARVSVPVELRLAGVVLADLALLAWAWRIRLARPNISLPVQGTALAILMLTVFAAFRLLHLIPGSLAFVMLILITAATCLMAIMQNAQWLAIFGIVGGFATPILASSGGGSHIALFSYYALLNLAVLAIALLRSWRVLNLLGFGFTFVIGAAWGVLRYTPENYLSAQLFLILFFLFYVAIAFAYARKQAPALKHYVDGTLVFGTPILAFGLQSGLMRFESFGLAQSALALALFYAIAALALWERRGGTLKLLVESWMALAIVFGTLTIPFALDGRWTSAAWALEGTAILWVGIRQRQQLAWAFGMLVQLCAWLSFLGTVAYFDSPYALGNWQFVPAAVWDWHNASINLLGTPILGALLITGGAALSAWCLRQYGDARQVKLSGIVLCCAGLWYILIILPILAAWLMMCYQRISTGVASPQASLWWCAYGLLVAATGPALMTLARRLGWPSLLRGEMLNWSALAIASAGLLSTLYGDYRLPDAEAWLAWLALWLANEWLMRAGQRKDQELSAPLLQFLHTLRSATPWLMIWPVASILIARALQAGDPASAELLADAGWHASASWSRFLPAWLMMAALGWLMRRTRASAVIRADVATAPLWPVAPVAEFYRTVLIPLGCGWALLLVSVWNLTQNGAMAPLPYLPLINPLDLSNCYALLLALSCYRQLQAAQTPQQAIEHAVTMQRGQQALAMLAYGWFNLALLRAMAQYRGLPYEFDALFDSQFVQATLSLTWSVTALLCMRHAAAHANRPLWIGGAGLLGMVVLKLFLIDLSNVGGIERIVTFLGVGGLMILIGYLAPWPSEREPAPHARAA